MQVEIRGIPPFCGRSDVRIGSGIGVPTFGTFQAFERAHSAGSRRTPDLREPVFPLPLCQHGEGPERSGARRSIRKPYLPSGGAAKDARVTEVIVRGRNMMPA